MPSLWSTAERRAWRIPPKISVSQWSEQNRVLSRAQSHKPGPMRNSEAPYGIGIMNALDIPGITEIDVQKNAQGGISQFGRSWLGHRAENEPDPGIVVWPNERDGRRIVKTRLLPLFDETPSLKALQTGIKRDISSNMIVLANGFSLRLAFSGSPTSLKSDPIRYALLDEVDDYAKFAGTSADPLSMVDKRTITYGERAEKMVVSTPTTEEGVIHLRRSTAPIQLRYHVPCSHCGKYQVMTFDRLKWGKPDGEHTREQQAAWIKKNDAAWYECSGCEQPMRDVDRDRAVRRGAWATEEIGPQLKWSAADRHIIAPDGTRWPPGENVQVGWPAGDRIGYHIWLIYCLWTPLWKIVRDWLTSFGNVGATMDFWNQVRGEPYRQKLDTPEENVFAEKSQRPWKPRVLPSWCQRVLGTVDHQKGYNYLVIRAWGPRMQSRRVFHGMIISLEEVRELCFGTIYPFEHDPKHGQCCDLVGIDRRFEPEDIDRFCRSDGRLKALMGDYRALADWTRYIKSLYQPPPPRKAYKAFYHLFDANRCKDWLAGTIESTVERTDKTTGELIQDEMWQLNSEDDPVYNSQMSSERKVIDRKGKTVWVKERENHYWDCYSSDTEVLTCDGWKFFTDLSGVEGLATVDLATDLLEYQKPLHLIRKKYDGPMIHFHARKCDLLVTPSHRMVVSRWTKEHAGLPPDIVKASDVFPSQYLKMSAKWVGEMPPRFPRDADPGDMAELAGWFVSEGYCRLHKGMRKTMIYQNYGPKRDIIRNLFQRLPWKWHESRLGLVLSHSEVYNQFSGFGNTATKRVPQWIKNAPPHLIERFLEAAVLGDGWKGSNVGLGGRRYATISPGLANDMQELFFKAGRPASITKHKAKPYLIRGRSGDNTKPQYWVYEMVTPRILLRDSAGKPNFGQVEYSGEVVCATVPNGTLVVRRNGKMAVCGNCENMQRALAWIARVETLEVRAMPRAPNPESEARRPARAPIRRSYE